MQLQKNIPQIEEARESLGLLIAALALGMLGIHSQKRSSTPRLFVKYKKARYKEHK